MDDNFEWLNSFLWRLVHNFSNSKNTLNTKEDLINEARATAFVAISNYNAEKSASMKTYVWRCVENRLKDLYKSEKRSPELVHCEVMPEAVAFDDIKDLEFNMTMQSLLTLLEYKVYYKAFVEDKGLRQIAKESNLTYFKVQKCYTRILQKFQSIESTQEMISTKLQLQDQWLASSPI